MESDEVFVLARQPKKIHRIWWKPMKSDSIFGVVTRIAASVMSSRTNTHHRRVEAHSERCEESGEGRWNAHRRTQQSKNVCCFCFRSVRCVTAAASMRAVCRSGTRQDHACVWKIFFSFFFGKINDKKRWKVKIGRPNRAHCVRCFDSVSLVVYFRIWRPAIRFIWKLLKHFR